MLADTARIRIPCPIVCTGPRYGIRNRPIIQPRGFDRAIQSQAPRDSATRPALARLRELGYPLVVDDFGIGYSSLSCLERLELDALKIDKSFVDGIGTGTVTGGVIGHIIEMADTLGLEAVAEGIENAEQLRWLLQRGVRLGQGYHFSPPLPAAEFVEFLAVNSGKVRSLSQAALAARSG